MWNLKFKSLPTVAFLAAVNHNNYLHKFVCGQSMDREKQKPTKWIEIHLSNDSGGHDLLTLFASVYLFCETWATLIDRSEKCNHWW